VTTSVPVRSHPAWIGIVGVGVITAVALLAALRDPPWLGSVTSGLSPWIDAGAVGRVRWTTGHATFYVPSDAAIIVIPIRAVRLTDDVLALVLDVQVDGRPVHRVRLENEQWRRVRIAVGLLRRVRRVRRIEIRVSRTAGRSWRGVQVGEVDCETADGRRLNGEAACR
jgi:hypothetical protein